MDNKQTMNYVYALISMVFVVSLAGCNIKQASSDGDKGSAPEATRKLEPVTLRMHNLANTTEYNFETKFKAHVEKKYPHIKLEFVPNVKGSTLPELATAGNLPDLVFGKTSDQDIMMDLNPLIKQYNFDKSRVKPVLWETYSYLTDTDQKTLFIPLATNMHLLHYNKGIFDRFGVPYPKDGMTWDQTYELARKLARTENGVKYLGFNIRANLNLSGTQLLLPYYDSKSDKAVMNTDGWKRYFANFSRFFEIAGNEVTKAGNELANDDLFLKKQTVAMYAAHPLFSVLADLPATGSDLNWDIVSLPNFPEAPRQGTSANTNGLGITISSKHKDDAFLVIQTLLSDEVQLANARTGYESVLVKDEQQQKEFGKEYSVLNGKNIPAIFYNKYAPTPQFNDYNSRIKNTPYNHFRRVVWGEADINTALRDAEEEMNKLIEQVKLEKKK